MVALTKAQQQIEDDNIITIRPDGGIQGKWVLDMDRNLYEVVAELAMLIGLDPVDLQDGHDRWAVYRQAADASIRNDLLLQVATVEPDSSIALSLVLRMLERLPPGDRPIWVSSLPVVRDREYASKRASELGILESAIAGHSVLGVGSSLDGWSEWLQLRLAESCDDRSVLYLLSQHGRTKRIRGTAVDRIRVLSSQ